MDNARILRAGLCAEKAYELLCILSPRSIYSLSRLELKNIRLDGIIIDTCEHFAELSNTDTADNDGKFMSSQNTLHGVDMLSSTSTLHEKTPRGMTCGGKLLGLTVKYGGINLILYASEPNADGRRLNWTIAHELGHIYLSHTGDSARNEAEADIFATETLMPEPAIRTLEALYGRRMTAPELTVWFNASSAAAKRRVTELETREYCRLPAGERLNKLLFPWLRSGAAANELISAAEIYK